MLTRRGSVGSQTFEAKRKPKEFITLEGRQSAKTGAYKDMFIVLLRLCVEAFAILWLHYFGLTVAGRELASFAIADLLLRLPKAQRVL